MLVNEINTVKGSELPPATILTRTEQLIGVQSGVTKRIPITLLNELLVNSTYISGKFTNANVVDGIATINHGLNTNKIVLFISNPSGENQWVPWKRINSTTLTINFGGPIEDGDWEYIILYWLAGSDFNENTLFKTIDIGIWDMSSLQLRYINHGIADATKIVSVSGIIIPDTAGIADMVIPGQFMHVGTNPNPMGVAISKTATQIILSRTGSSGLFVTNFSSVANSRGIIHIVYKTE